MKSFGRLAIAALVLVLCSGAWHSSVSSEVSSEKALRFGKLWDGNGKIIEDAVVVVKGDRIVRVSKGQVPDGAEVIDLSSLAGLPGLIDVHTHLTYYYDPLEGGNPWGQVLGSRMPAITVFLAQENARKTVESGVTTVRNLGARAYTDIAMRDLIARGTMVGPRMYVSGHGLHITFASARPEDAFLYAGVADGPQEVYRVARQELFGAGADVLKIFGSTGSGADTSGHPTFTLEEIRAAVDAAHNLGKKVAVHAYGPEAARIAVQAGADSIEHAPDLDDETLAEMARRGITYVPTIDHNRYYIDEAELFSHGQDAIERLEDLIKRGVETTRRAHRAGVRIAMGSDAVFGMCGQNARELNWLIRAGMSHREALTAATRNGAVLLGMEDSLGAVAPGHYADIIAVEGDPLEDIGAVVDGVRWVMKGGQVIVDRTR